MSANLVEPSYMKQARFKLIRGFTLIEVMVVVVIVGLLATMIMPRLIGQQDRAAEVKVKADIRELEAQLALYRLDNFDYPSSSQGIKALVNDPGTKGTWRGYLEKLPKDPWGNDYQYRYPGQKNPNKYDVWSYGADNTAGGEGNKKDIGNWE